MSGQKNTMCHSIILQKLEVDNIFQAEIIWTILIFTIYMYHIKEQSLIQKQPSKSEGCFCIYARKAHNIRLSGLFLFSGDLVD